jgi:hypothetical protein
MRTALAAEAPLGLQPKQKEPTQNQAQHHSVAALQRVSTVRNPAGGRTPAQAAKQQLLPTAPGFLEVLLRLAGRPRPKHLHLGAVLGTSLPDGFCQKSVTEPTVQRVALQARLSRPLLPPLGVGCAIALPGAELSRNTLLVAT